MAIEQPVVAEAGSSDHKRGRWDARLFSWLLALLIPAFAVWTALANPIEEHAFDAASSHIYRGVVYSAARAEGVAYPYWVMPINNGLGGPLFTFYSPGTYYLMDVLYSVGFSHPLAWRILVALSLIAASMGTFGLGLALFRRADLSLIGAAAFTYAPFLLRDLFERGSPQGIALALSPWVLWSLCLLAEHPSGIRLAFASAAWAIVILFHNLTGIMLVPVIGIFVVFLSVKYGYKVIFPLLLALVMAFLLSAVHIFPFLAERGDVQLEKAADEKYTQLTPEALPLASIFAPPIMMDTGLDNNTTGHGIGFLRSLIVVASVVVMPALWQRKRKAEAILLAGLFLLWLVAVLLRTSLAAPVWEAYPWLDALQLRWRFLGTTGLVAAIAAGYLVDWWPRHQVRLKGSLAALLTVALIGLQLPMLYPQLQHRYVDFSPSPDLADIDDFARQVNAPGLTLTAFNELLPRWRGVAFTSEERQQVLAGPLANLPEGAQIVADERQTEHFHIQLETPVDFQAALHILYFPGWQGSVDGLSQPLYPMDGTGYTLINVPAGNHTIELDFVGTPAQRIGRWTSLGAVLALILLAVFWRASQSDVVARLVVWFQPRWWIILLLVGVVSIKGLWIDPYTTWLRRASSCGAIQHVSTQVNAEFGEQIRLCGYTVKQTTFHPGETVRVWLYWQIDHPADRVVYSYVHVLGTAFNPVDNTPVWGQQDKQIPAQHPLTEWVPGKLYRDAYEFVIPSHTPTGDYQLEIGWYLPEGQRLVPRLSEGENQLALTPNDSVIIADIIIR